MSCTNIITSGYFVKVKSRYVQINLRYIKTCKAAASLVRHVY